MRRTPKARTPGRVPPGLPTSYRQDADAVGDGIVPFFASGGRANFLEIAGAQFAAEDGVQLVTSVYVPPGRVGWIKQIRIAPRKPSPLAPLGVDSAGLPAYEFFAPLAARAVAVWDVPMAWESYTSEPIDFAPGLPSWWWSLTLLQGTIAEARGVRLPFDPLDEKTQYLLPDVAVDAEAYGEAIGGIDPVLPGQSPGSPFSRQKMQIVQGDELTFHVQIPPDHTALLFARWRQEPFTPIVAVGEGATPWANPVYPLWPSFGSLLGYTQPTTNDAAISNARFGWGG